VSREGDRTFVVLAGSDERRDVRVGRYNNLWVQVLEGLSEGEILQVGDAKAERFP
jgi:multidrug efflux pump subunit AcrA (membrane-fusion protein)